MKTVRLFTLLVFLTSNLFPQKVVSIASNELKNPLITNYGLLFTLTGSSSLYIEENGNSTLLNSSPGCGEYYTLSQDEQTAGFKYINDNGQQVPALINLKTKEITYLHSPAELAGQVSFADNGTYAYTIGNDLIIHSASGNKKYDLGSYSNVAPISPYAKYVAFNNNDDQIFILNLTTGEKQKITTDSNGYFSPSWSPDGSKLLYSSLAGSMKVYDLLNRKTYSLGIGFSPSWSADSRLIVYYKKDIKKDEVINSDIYVSAFDGSSIKRITSTNDELETDPTFGSSDNQIVYSLAGSETLVYANFSPVDYSISNKKQMSFYLNPVKFSSKKSLEKVSDIDTLNVPYINQLYDTPGNFNGSAACAPTSAMMVLAFYNILPVWNTYCANPYHHYNSWGNYISNNYYFRQSFYNLLADDPSGKPSGGAYGFMWSGTYDPYARMVGFFENHGLSAERYDSPTYNMALNEVNAGRPYTVCVGLTSAGHVVVAHGTATVEHTLIFNDPYGDKNNGYPNYSGKNIKYDWPGYNNGFKSLNTVYWSVAVNYKAPTRSDTLIDDLDFGHGFYINTKSPSSMAIWKDLNQGYDGHMFYSTTTDSSKPDSCYAVWTPNLPKQGIYEVSSYISSSQATAAEYKINTVNGLDTIILDQSQYKNSWVPLGQFEFAEGNSGYVSLDDQSTITGQTVIYDAVKWIYIDSIATAVKGKSNELPKEFVLEQNYPNPFNPTTEIQYSIPKNGFVTLKVYNLLGQEVMTLVNQQQMAGSYKVNLSAGALASGIYMYRLQTGNFTLIKKMVVLK